MLSTAGNPKDSVPYGNPSGRPPEESIPIVLAPQFERPASPTPLEGQSFAKKGKSDGSLGDNGSEDMDADGVMVINDGLKDADRADSGDALKAGESQLQFENPSLGKATYASVVDKDSSNSNMAKSGSKFVEEEIEKERDESNPLFHQRKLMGRPYKTMNLDPSEALAKWFCLSSSSSSRYSIGLQPHVPQMDSRDRTGFYLMMLLLRSFGRARSSLVFYVWLALLDLEVMG
ncbi:hypothetical protein V6N12_018487 [Hibiscus sabdariffa]|uniref:Uncharacterized protein n=1 Tax=Hibiscus sabdariffa TaxID=183260 RepID=A0ABR1ZJF8_9ROSI